MLSSADSVSCRPSFRPKKQRTVNEERRTRLSDLLANFRQDIKAEAVFLINDRGLIQARTGALRDSSMEVSLISTLMAIHGASLKVARYNHQESLIRITSSAGATMTCSLSLSRPITPCLVAGNGLATEDRILET
jgi:hypothetical protein